MPTFTLDEASARRLSSMLRWYEAVGKNISATAAQALRHDDEPSPQWLIQPVPITDGWNIRVWYGFAAIHGQYIFPPTETEYIDVPLELEAGVQGYVIWYRETDLTFIEIHTEAELAALGKEYRILGTVKVKESGAAAVEQLKHDEIEITTPQIELYGDSDVALGNQHSVHVDGIGTDEDPYVVALSNFGNDTDDIQMEETFDMLVRRKVNSGETTQTRLQYMKFDKSQFKDTLAVYLPFDIKLAEGAFLIWIPSAAVWVRRDEVPTVVGTGWVEVPMAAVTTGTIYAWLEPEEQDTEFMHISSCTLKIGARPEGDLLTWLVKNNALRLIASISGLTYAPEAPSEAPVLSGAGISQMWHGIIDDTPAAGDSDLVKNTKSVETLDGALQLVEFENGKVVGSALADLLKADPDNGDITAEGGEQYEILVRVKNSSKDRRVLAYMALDNPPPGSADPEGTGGSDDGCQHNQDPSGGGGGGDDPPTVPPPDPHGEGPDGGDPAGGNHGEPGVDDFPGKTGPCW